jgi:FkbM family methyltransferase
MAPSFEGTQSRDGGEPGQPTPPRYELRACHSRTAGVETIVKPPTRTRMSTLHTARSYLRSFGMRGLSTAIGGKLVHHAAELTVSREDLRAPLCLRLPSADFAAYQQVMVKRDYDFAVTRPPRTIIDAGAHIGLASVWFANRFPNARIVAVEPEAANFELLRRNAAPYANITPVRAAIWDADVELNVIDPGVGTWGFMTSAAGDPEVRGERRGHVRGVTIDELMREHGLDHIDVLKLDIEGAEREVFAAPGAWLERTDLIVAELHERLKVGCNRAFYRATAAFDREWCKGENVFVARSAAGVGPASTGEA